MEKETTSSRLRSRLSNKKLWIPLVLLLGAGAAYVFLTTVTRPAPTVTERPGQRATDTPAATVALRPTATAPPAPTEALSLEPSATISAASASAPITEENVAELVPLLTLSGHSGAVTDVSFSPDGAIVASSSKDGTLRLWTTSDGTLLNVLEGHAGAVRSLAYSPDGAWLASGSDDRTARLWEVGDGSLIRVISSSILGRVTKVEFSPDGSLLAVGGHLCAIELRRTASGILRRTMVQPGCPFGGQGGPVEHWGLGFSPDGLSMATGDGRPCCGGGSLALWQIDSYAFPQLLRGFDLVVRDLAFSPDGSTLALALVGSSEFWLLNVEDGNVTNKVRGHTFRVNSLDYSPDSSLLISASNDTTVRLWRAADGEQLHMLEGHVGAVNSAVFSRDGSRIASGSEDGTVIVWGPPAPSQ